MTCETPCDNCNRQGLPILFTRYAAAYSARDEGMKILKELRPTGQFQPKPGGVALRTALYNVRMLRAGYLYLLIEVAGEKRWEGYAVHPHGYLTQFPVSAPEKAKVHVACARDSRQANASLVWVKDAIKVIKLWYMFHPDPIDYTQLKKKIELNPAQYMQSFDVAGWTCGIKEQQDTCQPFQINNRIMEFSALTNTSVQTVACEQHFGLMGVSGGERDWGEYTEARYGPHFESVRHETRGLDGNTEVTDFGAVSGKAVGPYLAEVKNVSYADRHGPRLNKMIEFLLDKKGAVLACEDAIGIAQELALHHLTAAMPYVAWLKEIDSQDKSKPKVSNEWKHAASESIKIMEQAIQKRAMLVYDEETERQRRVREVMGQRHPYPVGKILLEKDGRIQEVSVKDLEAQRKKELEKQIEQRNSNRETVSEEEAKKAVAKIQAHYDVGARKTFDENHKKKIEARDKCMDAITEDLIVWLRSDAFTYKTLDRYNKTPQGITSGDSARCVGQLCAILNPMDSSPRGRQWYADLQLFKDDPKNPLWRMVTFNNEEISQELQRVLQTLENTVPPASEITDQESVEEDVRRQKAWVAMGAALSSIPKTIKGSESIIKEVGKILDGKTSMVQKFTSLTKIASTAQKNIHTVWCVAVIEAVKRIEVAEWERMFARAQLLLLAHGLGDEATEFVRDQERKLADAIKAKGQQGVYSNKRNPEPGSRAWQRSHDYKAEKLQARTDAAVSLMDKKAVQGMRIPSVIAGLEVLSLLPTFGSAAQRGDDPRAGSQAAASVAAAMGTLKGWQASLYEQNTYEAIKVRFAQAARADEMLKASGNKLQTLKIGAAHYVAAAAVVGVVWDAIDAKKNRKRGDQLLMYAYYGRALSGAVSIGSALANVYYAGNARAVLLCMRINIVTGLMTLAATYAIDKLKEKEWIYWLQAQPFRKSDSKEEPYRSQAAMDSALVNTIADMG